MPHVNYREKSDSSEEDANETYESVTSKPGSSPTTPLSPSNQNFYLQTSPPPTRQVLRDVASNLRTVEAIQNVVPNWPPFQVESEEVAEEIIMPDEVVAEVDFEDENVADGAKALE